MSEEVKKGKKPIRVEEKSKKPVKIESLKDKIINIKMIIIFCVVICIGIIAFLVPKFLVPDIETVKDSVVMIKVYDEAGELVATGSGFSAYKENWIVTNFHVIEGAHSINVLTDDKKELEVTDIIIFNKKDDLAIISINGSLKNLTLGNGDNLKVKSNVTAIGSPKGEQNTVSEGIISNSDEKDIIRTTAPISHGSSGGVLLNNKNQVIGITSAGYDDAQNLNFAINVNVLKKMYSAYEEEKYFVIDDSNYKSCAPNIVNYNTKNKLEIKNKCTDSNYYNNVVASMTNFYIATNSYEIFNTAMYKIGINGFNVNYKRMTKDDQILASQYYQELLKYEDCDTDAMVGCTIDDIYTWNAERMVMELDILETYSLAIFLVEVEKYNSSTMFDYIDSLPLSIPEKGIISLL